MSPDQKHTDEVMETLANLIASGTEQEVRAYVKEHFEELPADIRERYMFDILSTTLNEALRRRDTVVEIQEQGIEAFDVLDQWEKQKDENTSAEQGLT
jgi:hypothetical protein